MKKNVSGQIIGAQMITAADGSVFTGSVSVAVTKDGGTQAAGGGTVTHEGNGFHSYTPTQAETNADHIGFTFTGTGAVAATIQVYPTFPQTGDNYSRLGAPAGASIAADIATVDGVADSILVDTGTTLPAQITALNDLDSTDVQTAAAAALTAYDPPTKAELDSGLAGLNDLSAADVNAEVDTALADYDAPTKAEIDSAFGALNDLSAADVNAQVDTALADYDGPTKAEMDSAFTEIKGATFAGATDSLEAIRDRGDAAWTGGGSAPTAADIADAVWTEAIADHSGTSGSTAEALNAAGSAGDPWVTALPGSYTTGQAGKILADVLTDTNELQGDDIPGLIAALNDLSAADVNAQVDSALADYDGPTKSEMDAAFSALNDLSASDIRTALGLTSANLDTQLAAIDTVVDAILVDTGTGVAISGSTANQIADALLTRDFSSVTGEAARSALNALRFLRNKWSVSGTTLTVTEEDDATAAWTATVTADAGADPITGSDPA